MANHRFSYSAHVRKPYWILCYICSWLLNKRLGTEFLGQGDSVLEFCSDIYSVLNIHRRVFWREGSRQTEMLRPHHTLPKIARMSLKSKWSRGSAICRCLSSLQKGETEGAQYPYCFLRYIGGWGGGGQFGCFLLLLRGGTTYSFVIFF